jgi:hypothetical protein
LIVLKGKFLAISIISGGDMAELWRPPPLAESD